jgi:alcohol dehydrogenase (cytochrome c)
MAAAAVAVALWAPGATADIAEGTIDSINRTANTLNVGDKTFQWSSMNSVGPALQDLKEGDGVNIRFIPTQGGKNVVQRITLVEAAAAATPAGWIPVTDERLAHPEPGSWLMTRGNYEGWSYSPLDQINKENVANLVPVWTFSTGVESAHESPPIVNGRMMFVSTPYGQVIALDATDGEVIWRYKRELPDDFFAHHQTNRGVALYGDKVYLAAIDAYLVAIDAETGEQVWEKQVEDWRTGHYMTLAPLVAKGKVMVGVSGGEYGVRGFVQAFDAETGDEAWKTYTIPGPGEPGHDTWQGDDWQHGGGAVWMTGNYDPEANLTYWGTGNAAPWFGDQHPGDNLYTSSTVAIDPDTGAIKGHFQYHWNDSWDWDEMNAPMVVDYEKDGQTVKGLIKPSRNGYLYWLERTPEGPIGFVDATNYVKQDVFASIDPKTGRPTYNEDRKPVTGKSVEFCPGLWGGKDWPYEAFNPNTRMVYIPANDNHCHEMEGKIQEYVPGQWWTGIDIPDIHFIIDKDAGYLGELQAWNVDTGEKVWSQTHPTSMNWGSVLTTASDLIFMGGTNDRMFRAFDAETGDVLWKIKTNSGVIAPPVSYEVDGIQYIAVQSGYGVDPAFQQGLLNDLLGMNVDVPQGGIIWVFALGQ